MTISGNPIFRSFTSEPCTYYRLEENGKSYDYNKFMDYWEDIKMKIKRSELKKANATLEKTIDFLIDFLDYSTDEQTKYVNDLIDDLSSIQKQIYNSEQNNNK